jgi:hypothetical protein
MYLNKKYKVVIIDHPISVMDDPMCANLLGKSLKMKFDGYRNTYGDNVLPMDKADFFGTHITFCEETETGLIPIFAYKSTPYARCLDYGFEFPGIALMKSDGDPSCVRDLLKIIEKVGDPKLISYDSSWAQNLDYRFTDNVKLKEELREIMMMVIVKHHEEFNIPHMVTCGVVKVKTDQFFLKIGLNKLNDRSTFSQKSINGDDAVIFYNNTFSSLAFEMKKKHEHLWKDKLVIDGISVLNPSIRKAA